MTMPTGEELRELLELAAKAYGAEFFSPKRGKMSRWWHLDGVFKEWRPHEDDGDVLRLAVKLQIALHHGTNAVSAVYDAGIMATVKATDDRFADCRLAVLRCAAEVGRAMGEDNE